MGEFIYASFGGLKDVVLEEMPQGGFGLFGGALSLWAYYNMEYAYESSLLEMGKNIRG